MLDVWVPIKRGSVVGRSIYRKHVEESAILQASARLNGYAVMWNASQLTPHVAPHNPQPMTEDGVVYKIDSLWCS